MRFQAAPGALAPLWRLALLALVPITLLLAAPAPVGAAPAVGFPPLSGRVVDAAHLLNPAQVAQLTQLSAGIESASSRQFVVATIPDLQGLAIEDYGYQLGRAWKIGQKDANNGIILLVAPNERKVRIEVGYGLEPIMTDALASVIINDRIVPKFRSGDMAGGIVDGAQAIAEQMKLPPEAAEARARSATPVAQPVRHARGGFPIFWVVILVFFVLSIFRRGSGRSYRGGTAPVMLWGAGLGGWGGAGLGGSNWGGSSGGGSSWGGGGGGFSGGGGSFGGGGASGGW